MYSPGDWGRCSYVPVALLAAGGTEIKYFLWFLDLNPLSIGQIPILKYEAMDFK